MTPQYTLGEEIMNSITHGIGAVLALVGSGVLLSIAYQRQSLELGIAFSIYGSSLFLLYLMSTLYHSIPAQKAKHIFRLLDHASICLLIAGTYTPFALVTLRQGTDLGWYVFIGIWSMALIGVVLNIFFIDKFKTGLLFLYIAMGWVVVFVSKQLYDFIGLSGMLVLALGGVFYTAGVIFYKQRKWKFHHGVWHLFVLAGSLVHYFAILLFV